MTIGRLASRLCLALSAVLIPRLIGAEAYGQFAAWMAVIAIMLAVATFGLPMVAVRFLAPAWRVKSSQALVLGSTIWTTRIVLGLIAGLVVAIWIGYFSGGTQTLRLSVLIGIAAATFYLHDATTRLLLPIGRIGKQMLLELAHALGSLATILGGYYYFGFTGVFAGLIALHLLLMVPGYLWLTHDFPIRVQAWRVSVLRRHLRFSAATFLGALATQVQTWLAVYVLAVRVDPREAAFLAIAIHAFVALGGLFQSACQSVMPILAELENERQHQSIARWGAWMLQIGAAVGCVLTVGWSLLGNELTTLVLTDEFAPVYPCVAVILAAASVWLLGNSCNLLLFIRCRPLHASLNLTAFAVLTLAGMLWGIQQQLGASLRVATAYLGAAMVFTLLTYLALGWRTQLWLPWRRCLSLLLPCVLVWPALQWEAALAWRVAAFAGFLCIYGALSVSLRLLPVAEVRSLRRG